MKKLFILLTIAILVISCCASEETSKQNASERIYGSQTQEDPNKSSRIKVVARRIERGTREYQIVEIDDVEYIVVLYNQGGVAITPVIKK